MGYHEQKLQTKIANIEWIAQLKLPTTSDGVKVSVKFQGKKIDFWPASNTWYSHTKARYGVGIRELCFQIQTALQVLPEGKIE